MSKARRRLAAILCADVVGYSRLMQDNDEATLATLRIYRAIVSDVVGARGGRVVNAPGDALLTEFPSAVEAVLAALDIQADIERRNEPLPEARRMQFRIGVNLGDVLVEPDGTIYGDGVNVAARMEALADPGGICVSGKVFDEVSGRIAIGFTDLGEQTVKNIAVPVRAYALTTEDTPAETRKPESLRRKRITPTRIAIGATFAAFIPAALFWYSPISQVNNSPIEQASLEDMVSRLPEEPSIAVLPFDNLSGNTAYDYVADGLSENIISVLSRAPNMLVIARNSTFTYKDVAVNVQEVAEGLGVRYVVEGSIQVAEERIRVTTRLIDAVNGRQMWSEGYDRPLEDVFAFQDEITLNIVSALQVNLTAGPQALAWRGGTDSLQAWSLHQQGVAAVRRLTKEDNESAQRLFREAVAADPDFALAWSYLASAHRLEAFLEPTGSAESYELLTRAGQYARTALSIDPDLPEAHIQLAWVRLLRRDFDGAMELGDRAVELGPNHSIVLANSALLLMYSGELEKALQRIHLATRLSPQHPAWYSWILGFIHLHSERYEDVLAPAQDLVQRLPSNELGHELLVQAYAGLGRGDDARKALADVMAVVPHYSIFWVRQREKASLPTSPDLLKKTVTLLRAAGVRERAWSADQDETVIAVMPFSNLTGDPEQEYLSNGVAGDIIKALSHFPELSVIARASTQPYNDRTVDIRTIADDLDADFVVEGDLRRSGDNVRVSVRLSRTDDAANIWAQTYDREYKDIFAIQDDITIQVASTIVAPHRHQINYSARNTAPKDFTAYEYVLRASQLGSQLRTREFHEARKLLNLALDLDPDYARAHSMMASLYVRASTDEIVEETVAMAAVEMHARRALELDPYDCPAHTALAAYYRFSGQVDLFEAAWRKSLRLNPNDTSALAWTGFQIQQVYGIDRLEEGAGMARRAMRLNPRHPGWYRWAVLRAHFFSGRYDEAYAELSRHDWREDDLSGQVFAAMIHAQLGNDGQASEAAAHVRKINPDYSFEWHIASSSIHESYWDAYREAIVKAGLPLKSPKGPRNG